jgi:hypothetical protein
MPFPFGQAAIVRNAARCSGGRRPDARFAHRQQQRETASAFLKSDSDDELLEINTEIKGNEEDEEECNNNNDRCLLIPPDNLQSDTSSISSNNNNRTSKLCKKDFFKSV